MLLKDLWNEELYTLPRLYRDWQEFRKEDPINHADNFKRELFEILDATLRGRNDLEIVSPTGPELMRFYNKLLKEV